MKVRLSVLVPAYNEEATIKSVLLALLKQSFVHEIIVIDDASTDMTVEAVKGVKSKLIRLIQHSKNQGKGAAIVSGLAQVSGSHVLIQDADLEYDPDEIIQLLEPIEKGKATIVYGSRFTGPRKNMYFWHMVGNKMLSFLVNILYNTTLSDMETCYKVLPTSLFRDLDIKARDFAIEPEITCKVLSRGYFIYETPISYTGRTFEQGKKISWKDGFKAVFTIFYWRVFA